MANMNQSIIVFFYYSEGKMQRAGWEILSQSALSLNNKIKCSVNKGTKDHNFPHLYWIIQWLASMLFI